MPQVIQPQCSISQCNQRALSTNKQQLLQSCVPRERRRVAETEIKLAAKYCRSPDWAQASMPPDQGVHDPWQRLKESFALAFCTKSKAQSLTSSGGPTCHVQISCCSKQLERTTASCPRSHTLCFWVSPHGRTAQPIAKRFHHSTPASNRASVKLVDTSKFKYRQSCILPSRCSYSKDMSCPGPLDHQLWLVPHKNCAVASQSLYELYQVFLWPPASLDLPMRQHQLQPRRYVKTVPVTDRVCLEPTEVKNLACMLRDGSAPCWRSTLMASMFPDLACIFNCICCWEAKSQDVANEAAWGYCHAQESSA